MRNIKFKFSSPKRDGIDIEQINVLSPINYAHESRLDTTFAEMERDSATMKQWGKANKRARNKHTAWAVRDDAVWNGSKRCENEVDAHSTNSNTQTISARAASGEAGRSAQVNNAREVYSAILLDDVAPIQREVDEEDAGIVKPSRGTVLS